MISLVSLGQRIKRARKAAGVTQVEVANAMGYTSSQFISNIERGITTPPARLVPILASMINIPEDELVVDIMKAKHLKFVAKFNEVE